MGVGARVCLYVCVCCVCKLKNVRIKTRGNVIIMGAIVLN